MDIYQCKIKIRILCLQIKKMYSISVHLSTLDWYIFYLRAKCVTFYIFSILMIGTVYKVSKLHATGDPPFENGLEYVSPSQKRTDLKPYLTKTYQFQWESKTGSFACKWLIIQHTILRSLSLYSTLKYLTTARRHRILYTRGQTDCTYKLEELKKMNSVYRHRVSA